MRVVHLQNRSDDMGEELEQPISVEGLIRRQRRQERLMAVLAARVVAAEGMLRALGIRMDYMEDKLGKGAGLLLVASLFQNELLVLTAPLSPWW